MIRRDTLFQIIANIILILISLLCIIPFFLLFASAFSNETDILHNGYTLWPRVWDFTTFRYIGNSANGILRSYGMSAMVTVVGTVFGLFVSLLYAFPISRYDFRWRSGFSFYLFFTILFNGGFIPTYMMWTNYFHIKNSFWAYLLPNLMVNGFYVIMARNYFSQNIPQEIIESAKIDGAGEYSIFGKIVLPTAKPIMSTLGLFISLNYWNDWQNGLYYITNDKMYTIQVLLNRMLLDAVYMANGMGKTAANSIGTVMPTMTLKMAIAVMGVLPVLIIFPFASKYLTGGMVVGSVKG